MAFPIDPAEICHYVRCMEPTDAELIAAVLKGETASFEPLVVKYSPRLFAMARRYARRGSEVEDIVQEVWARRSRNCAAFAARPLSSIG